MTKAQYERLQVGDRFSMDGEYWVVTGEDKHQFYAKQGLALNYARYMDCDPLFIHKGWPTVPSTLEDATLTGQGTLPDLLEVRL